MFNKTSSNIKTEARKFVNLFFEFKESLFENKIRKIIAKMVHVINIHHSFENVVIVS
jgi:hypothetical protein